MVSEILEKKEVPLLQISGSKYVLMPAAWLDRLNMKNKKKLTGALVRSDKHGYFFCAWDKNNKPKVEILE